MRLRNGILQWLPSKILCQFIHHACWTVGSFLNFTSAIQQIGNIMQSTNIIGSSSMAGRTSLIHLSPLRYILSDHLTHPIFKNGSILHILIHTPMVHLSLSPFFDRKMRNCISQDDLGVLPKHSSMFQNPLPTFNIPTYLTHVIWGAHVKYQDKALMDILCFEASHTSESTHDKQLWR